MKIKDGFILREVAGNSVVVAVGKRAKEFNGVINLSGAGADIWKHLQKDISKEELIDRLLEEYDVEREVLTKDVDSFLQKIGEAGLLEQSKKIMVKLGFDKVKYLEMQSAFIMERVAMFGDKLYLELGGKLFDDFHASRVLPGFDPDIKINMLSKLKDKAEILMVINASDIEKNKIRGEEVEISTPDSKVKVFVIPTNEELVIARDTLAIVDAL